MELAEPHTSKTRRQPLPAERIAAAVLLRALLRYQGASERAF